MNRRTFELLCAIRDWDLDNGHYVFAEDVEDTSVFFGTKEKRALLGKWCAVYKNMDEPLVKLPNPDFVLQFENCTDEVLWLYCLED